MGNQKFEYWVYDMNDKELLVCIGDIWKVEKFLGRKRSAICKAVHNKVLIDKRYKIKAVRI